MKKMTLVCMAGDRKQTLNRLRELGVVHLVNVQEPESSDLSSLRDGIKQAETAIGVLNAIAEDGDQVSRSEQKLPVADLVERVHELQATRAELADTLHSLDQECHVLEPYGSFEPSSIKALQEHGVIVRLFNASAKNTVVPPEDTALVPLGIDTGTQYFAILGRSDFECSAEELPLPERSLDEVRKDRAKTEEQLKATEDNLRALSAGTEAIRGYLSEQESRIEYAEARDGMGERGKLVYLQGFAPVHSIEDITSNAGAQGWGLVIEDPTDEEQPPTLVRYPKWVKPIKAVFDVLGILPGYREADISMVFLIFFSVFFAMLIGDAGYGVLFLALTIYARRKLKDAPAYPFILFGILSVCTATWGVMTGNYFGIPTEALPPFLLSLRCGWLTDAASSRDNIIKLCFMIGALHLTVAHVWNAVVLFPSRKWLAQVGWIGLVWCMFYAAGHYVLGYDYPSWILTVFLPSIILVALFMTPRKELKTEWIHHAMLPLSVINCFVDVISYIRLFAVGMASAKVAMSVNMIFGLGPSKIWTIPIIAVVLLAGHALNIALCGLGILVHGVRLNTLEFSLHRDMQWSGFPYKPFSNE